jgi:hypothetical protein
MSRLPTLAIATEPHHGADGGGGGGSGLISGRAGGAGGGGDAGEGAASEGEELPRGAWRGLAPGPAAEAAGARGHPVQAPPPHRLPEQAQRQRQRVLR